MLKLYLTCARDAGKNLARNWLILPGMIVLYMLFMFLAALAAPLGILGGFILGLGGIALLSYFYSWIVRSSRQERLTLKKMYQFDQTVFQPLLSAAFLVFILTFPLSLLPNDPQMSLFKASVALILVLVFNALPEVVYVHRQEGFASLKEAANFTITNWIEWYIPFLIILSPWMILIGGGGIEGILFLIASGSPIFPPLVLMQTPLVLLPGFPLVGMLLSLVLIAWYMLFRAELFRDLDTGGYRARKFKAKL